LHCGRVDVAERDDFLRAVRQRGANRRRGAQNIDNDVRQRAPAKRAIVCESNAGQGLRPDAYHYLWLVFFTNGGLITVAKCPAREYRSGVSIRP